MVLRQPVPQGKLRRLLAGSHKPQGEDSISLAEYVVPGPRFRRSNGFYGLQDHPDSRSSG